MDSEKVDDDVSAPRDSPEGHFQRGMRLTSSYASGKLIAFLDAQSLVDQRGQNPMMGQMGGGGSRSTDCSRRGVQFDTAKSSRT
jgi:hypothetical protein